MPLLTLKAYARSEASASAKRMIFASAALPPARLDHRGLQQRSDGATPSDDVEDGQLAVEAQEHAERGDGQNRGVDVDDTGFHDLDGDRGNQADHRSGHAEEKGRRRSFSATATR